MKDTWNSAEINEALNDGSYGNGGAGLPTPEEGDTGKILTLDSNLEPSWESPAKDYSLDYTTTPVNTGIKFNGKDIKRVIVPLGSATGTISSGFTITLPETVTPADIIYFGLSFYNNQYHYYSTGYGRISGTHELNVSVNGTNYSSVELDKSYLILDYIEATT